MTGFDPRQRAMTRLRVRAGAADTSLAALADLIQAHGRDADREEMEKVINALQQRLNTIKRMCDPDDPEYQFNLF